MSGLWVNTGIEQWPIVVKKHNQNITTCSFRDNMPLLVKSVASFSNAPLKGIFYFGLSISLFAGIYILYLVNLWIQIEKSLSDWNSVMASIWLLGGIIISCLGVKGIYLSKVFSATKRRP